MTKLLGFGNELEGDSLENNLSDGYSSGHSLFSFPAYRTGKMACSWEPKLSLRGPESAALLSCGGL